MTLSPDWPRRASTCGQGVSFSILTWELGKRQKMPGMDVAPCSPPPAPLRNPSHNRCLGQEPVFSREKSNQITKSMIFPMSAF